MSRQGSLLRDGTARLKFIFQVTVADRDLALLESLRHFLGHGSIRRRPRPVETWLPAATYSITSHRAHRLATIPFAESYLLPCAKHVQFERWRDRLDECERTHPNRHGKGPSPCSVDGCEKPVRGRGLCRSHYYRATGY